MHTSLYAVSDDRLNRPMVDCHLPSTVKHQLGKLSATGDATVSRIKDGRMTKTHVESLVTNYPDPAIF